MLCVCDKREKMKVSMTQRCVETQGKKSSDPCNPPALRSTRRSGRWKVMAPKYCNRNDRHHKSRELKR
jgi:hypothetical protein